MLAASYKDNANTLHCLMLAMEVAEESKGSPSPIRKVWRDWPQTCILERLDQFL